MDKVKILKPYPFFIGPKPEYALYQEDAARLLSLAINFNRVDMCKLLIDSGARIDRIDGNNEAPLIHAARRGHAEICQLLLDSKAAHLKRLAIESHLLHMDYYVNSEDKDKSTPFLVAAENNHETVCKLLLAAGANINQKDKYGAIAIISTQNRAIRRLILDHGTNGVRELGLVWAARQYRDYHLANQICAIILNDQAEANARIKTTLLCLNRLRNNGFIGLQVLCKNFNTLLHPYLEPYVSLEALINARDADGKTAYDYLPYPEIKPEKPTFFEKCLIQ